jgi:hypothetical protein
VTGHCSGRKAKVGYLFAVLKDLIEKHGHEGRHMVSVQLTAGRIAIQWGRQATGEAELADICVARLQRGQLRDGLETTATEVTMLRHRLALIVLLAVLTVGVQAQPASALHKGAIVDCGSAGTFTLRAQQTSGLGNLQAPGPADVILFEEGGVLVLFKFVRDGQVIFDNAAIGAAMNNLDEVTCTFQIGDSDIEVTGILVER